MTASQPSLLELAKQGDATAIAALMNHHLQPKGVTATATLEDGCLQVALESQQVPNQPSLIEFVQKGITNLGVDAIKRVRVYGVQTGKTTPVWEQDIPLQRFTAIPNVPPLKDPLPAVDEVAPTITDARINAGADTRAVRADAIPLISTASASTSHSMAGDEFSHEPVVGSAQKQGLGSFLGRHWTVVPMMLLAALIGFATVVFLMSRGQRLAPQQPKASPLPTANSPSPTSDSSNSVSASPTTATAPSTSPPASPVPTTPSATATTSASPAATLSPTSPATPTATPSTTSFNQALVVGYSAAVNTQTAVTSAQWDAVVSQWQQAIELLGKVASTDPNYATAQQKIIEYERNLTYARQKLQQATAP